MPPLTAPGWPGTDPHYFYRVEYTTDIQPYIAHTRLRNSISCRLKPRCHSWQALAGRAQGAVYFYMAGCILYLGGMCHATKF